MKVILASALVLFSVSNAFAHGDHKEALMCSKVGKEELAKKGAEHQDKFLKKLKLTNEQKEQVKKIRQANSDAMFAQVQKIRGAHTELMGAVEKDGTKESIRERFNALSKEKETLMSMKLDQMFAIREVLTPEQRQKAITELKDKMNDLCD